MLEQIKGEAADSGVLHFPETEKQQNTARVEIETKRVPITEELQRLAAEQENLEVQRKELGKSLEGAFALLAPLREKMQLVVDCMEKFHEMENNYAILSRQTYEDIHRDMQAVSTELRHTKSLLDEGNKLISSGIEFPEMELPNEFLPKEPVKEEVKTESPVQPDVKENKDEQTKTWENTKADAKEMQTAADELDSILDDLNQQANGTKQEFYDALKTALEEHDMATIVAQGNQNSALVEMFLSSDIAALHPEFKYRISEDEQLRIRGTYTDGELSVTYASVKDKEASPILTDLVTMDTTNRIKEIMQVEIDKELGRTADYEATDELEEQAIG